MLQNLEEASLIFNDVFRNTHSLSKQLDWGILR